jgi:hypothetical protein
VARLYPANEVFDWFVHPEKGLGARLIYFKFFVENLLAAVATHVILLI